MESDSKHYLQELGPITSGFIGRILSVCMSRVVEGVICSQNPLGAGYQVWN